MTVLSALAGPALGYGRRTTRKVAVVRDVPVPMRDGVVLLADWYRPTGSQPRPVVLVRTPYGRNFIGGLFWGRMYAERGFQVVIQSVRGTHGSGGEFRAVSQEHKDGVDTLRWLRAQSWCDGRVATVGPSYLGYVQWALGPDEANRLVAMCPQVTSGRLPFFQGGTVALEDLASWTYGMAELIDGGFSLKTQLRMARASAGRLPAPVTDALTRLPTIEADRVLAGREVWHWRNWLAHPRPDDEWWPAEGGDWHQRAGRYTAPTHLVAGWYDVFLPLQLADYRAMRAAGRQPYLTVGPWTHRAPGGFRVAARESLTWLRAHLDGDRTALRPKPVRLFVTGARQWCDYDDWPASVEQRWHLHAKARLSPESPDLAAPDRFTYNPADPTPSIGGATLGRGAGPRTNNAVEARPDVLTYTSDVLERDVEFVGDVHAELFVASSTRHADFFVRLCDVDRRGRSTNVCDGVLRVYPEDHGETTEGAWRLRIDMWPIAHRFRRGHRLRVQVSGGAFPRFARNLGTGEGITSGRAMVIARQQVFHDPDRPSCLVLPARA